MLKGYFKTAWRHIVRNKLYSIINILGLSMGIATCFIIMLYVQDELSYDKFNTNSGNIFRIVFKANLGGSAINEASVMPPVAKALKSDFPEVKDATRLMDYGKPRIIYNGNIYKDDRFAYVDPNFFSIFTLPMIEGNPKVALQQPNCVVITESIAKKYFGGSSKTFRM